jgi:hypothetical protein
VRCNELNQVRWGGAEVPRASGSHGGVGMYKECRSLHYLVADKIEPLTRPVSEQLHSMHSGALIFIT